MLKKQKMGSGYCTSIKCYNKTYKTVIAKQNNSAMSLCRITLNGRFICLRVYKIVITKHSA